MPTNGISENYRELTLDEVPAFAERTKNAWQDAAIPERQWNLVVKNELEAFRRGQHVRPYDVLLSCLKMLPTMKTPTLLDVGCASGYYCEVLQVAQYQCLYHGVDSSESFIKFAGHRYHPLMFQQCDASNLPFPDNFDDIVLHSACIMHCVEWQNAIVEAARVAKKYVIFHRTPIADKMTYFAKEAYGIEVLELAFNQDELFEHFHAAGLRLIGFAQMGTSMKSFVMAKDA